MFSLGNQLAGAVRENWLGLTQAAGFVVVFRYLWAQATSTPSEVFDVAVKC